MEQLDKKYTFLEIEVCKPFHFPLTSSDQVDYSSPVPHGLCEGDGGQVEGCGGNRGVGCHIHRGCSCGVPVCCCQAERPDVWPDRIFQKLEPLFLWTFPNVDMLANDSKNCKMSRANQNRSEGQI